MELDQIIQNLNKKNYALSLGQAITNELSNDEKKILSVYHPEKHLIVYGTLAPNKPNHHVIAHIEGQWQKGIVRGILVNEGWGAELGYFGYTFAAPENQIRIEAQILSSESLSSNWPFLDEFEGKGYQRVLAKYELENGEIGVGNIYAVKME